MENVQYIEIGKLSANKYQPRTNFENKDLVELAESIMENGLIQPIIVRRDNELYEIIAGERRYRACMMLHHEKVPCVIIDVDDVKSAQLALVENIQRSNLSAIEEAIAYTKLIEQTGITQSELAKQMGKSQSAIANKIRLLTLPDNIQNLVSDKTLTERHARALLTVEPEKLDKIVNQIVKNKLNVAQTEKIVEDSKYPKVKEKKAKIFSKNIQVGINTIKHACDICSKSGIPNELHVEENDNEICVIVRFKKEN